jgi:hypothetical protein
LVMCKFCNAPSRECPAIKKPVPSCAKTQAL